ncbi:hypothetical protein [Agrobacterium pusense]|uniref:hypothetical protein n=1 Tax=Agrobacterium pusense TaxID=648995 RepID=UPI002F41F21E
MSAIDFDKDPFALPPEFEDDEKQQAVEVRRRSLVQWVADAIERGWVITFHVMAAVVLIALWGAILVGIANVAMAVIGGRA